MTNPYFDSLLYHDITTATFQLHDTPFIDWRAYCGVKIGIYHLHYHASDPFLFHSFFQQSLFPFWNFYTSSKYYYYYFVSLTYSLCLTLFLVNKLHSLTHWVLLHVHDQFKNSKSLTNLHLNNFLSSPSPVTKEAMLLQFSHNYPSLLGILRRMRSMYSLIINTSFHSKGRRKHTSFNAYLLAYQKNSECLQSC